MALIRHALSASPHAGFVPATGRAVDQAGFIAISPSPVSEALWTSLSCRDAPASQACHGLYARLTLSRICPAMSEVQIQLSRTWSSCSVARARRCSPLPVTNRRAVAEPGTTHARSPRARTGGWPRPAAVRWLRGCQSASPPGPATTAAHRAVIRPTARRPRTREWRVAGARTGR
jgi:hypothetical protein